MEIKMEMEMEMDVKTKTSCCKTNLNKTISAATHDMLQHKTSCCKTNLNKTISSCNLASHIDITPPSYRRNSTRHTPHANMSTSSRAL